MWQAPGAPRFGSVLIVADVERQDIRSYYETQFSERLAELGVKGVPSTPWLPDLAPLTREQVQAWVNEHGIEAVLVTRLVDISVEERTIALRDGASLYGDIGHGRDPMLVDVEDVETRLSTRLFDATTGEPVFEALSTTRHAVSPDNAANSVVAAMAEELAARELVAARASD